MALVEQSEKPIIHPSRNLETPTEPIILDFDLTPIRKPLLTVQEISEPKKNK